MAIWLFTGKPAGSMMHCAVSKIRERLLVGGPVVTNFDLRLDQLAGVQRKSTRVIRLPDKPSLENLECIGVGNALFDETKNGLLVLDESCTWSRTLADKDSQGIVDWLWHARAKGWDIIFFVQNISMVDTRFIESSIDYFVYCRRIDFANIYAIGSVFKLLTMAGLPSPILHRGIVRYGSLPTSLKIDDFIVFDNSLCRAYDNNKLLSDFNDDGVFSYLPPSHTHGRFK